MSTGKEIKYTRPEESYINRPKNKFVDPTDVVVSSQLEVERDSDSEKGTKAEDVRHGTGITPDDPNYEVL